MAWRERVVEVGVPARGAERQRLSTVEGQVEDVPGAQHDDRQRGLRARLAVGPGRAPVGAVGGEVAPFAAAALDLAEQDAAALDGGVDRVDVVGQIRPACSAAGSCPASRRRRRPSSPAARAWAAPAPDWGGPGSGPRATSAPRSRGPPAAGVPAAAVRRIPTNVPPAIIATVSTTVRTIGPALRAGGGGPAAAGDPWPVGRRPAPRGSVARRAVRSGRGARASGRTGAVRSGRHAERVLAGGRGRAGRRPRGRSARPGRAEPGPAGHCAGVASDCGLRRGAGRGTRTGGSAFRSAGTRSRPARSTIAIRRPALAQPVSGTSSPGRVSRQTGQCHR